MPRHHGETIKQTEDRETLRSELLIRAQKTGEYTDQFTYIRPPTLAETDLRIKRLLRKCSK